MSFEELRQKFLKNLQHHEIEAVQEQKVYRGKRLLYDIQYEIETESPPFAFSDNSIRAMTEVVLTVGATEFNASLFWQDLKKRL